MIQFCGLHVHGQGSTLDGTPSSEEYMARAKELGMTHLALTDHGTLSMHREFQRAAADAGVVPILGLEAYVTHDINDRRSQAKRQDGTKVYNHITLLATGETGLTNLNHLSSRAWSEGYYYKPRMSHDMICESNEGLIVLSGCLGGALCQAIEHGDMAYANSLMKQYKEAFGDRYYVEVMSSNPVEMNVALLEIAKKHGVKPVATPDCHYARPEDLWFEEAMLIIGSNPKRISEPDQEAMAKMEILERINYLYPDRSMNFEELELYLKGYQEEKERFARQGIDRTDILENTMEIASRIGEYPYHSGLDLLPKPKRPATDILREMVIEGMKRRGIGGTEVINRLDHELGVIARRGFDVYFLVVSDMVRWAKNNDILVGPGRGSAAGSLVCYCLGITEVNPLEYGLLFSRFLNETRADWPDIDIDFPDDERGRVKEYLRGRYEYVASIATFPRYQGKSAVRTAASALAVPIADVEKALKNNESGDEDFLDHFEQTEQGQEYIEKHPYAWELTKFIQGRISSIGMHPAGVVVSNQDLAAYMPIQAAKEKGSDARVPYIAYDMDEVAEVGGIKIDILGLKNLRVIRETIEMVHQRNPMAEKINLLELPLDNKKTYKMLAEGKTLGVFQMEGPAFTKWIKETKCDNFMDIVNGSAIARPGPMESIGPDYRAALLGEKTVHYENEIIYEITKDTLGYIVYQEQVQRFMTELAGMEDAESDSVRRSIAKKKDVKELEVFKDRFIEGASQHISRSKAQKYWADFEKHAKYSFNLSHSVAYSLISYWTAYLKANHTLEYMTALIRAESDTAVRTNYLLEARRLGIRVIPPHINTADVHASISEGKIILGLTDVKYIAQNGANALIRHRPFESYADVRAKAGAKGSGINSRIITSLNSIGGLVFEDNPVRGDEKDSWYDIIGLPVLPRVNLSSEFRGKLRKLSDYEESTAFATIALVKSMTVKPTWARAALVDETAPVDVFCPVDMELQTGKFYLFLIASNSIIRAIPLDDVENDDSPPLIKYLNGELALPDEGGERVIAFRARKTKKGDMMGTVVFIDHLGELYAALVFPRQYKSALPRLRAGAEVKMQIGETLDGTYYVAGFE